MASLATTAMKARLFVLSESRMVGLAIAEHARLEVASLEERRFEAGEFKLRPLVSVREHDVCVIETLAATPEAPIADRLVRLLFLLAGLRDAGARSRIALVPYLAYARKDRRTQVRDPVNTRYVAELLEAAGMTRLIALDVHNPAALDNACRVPVDHLSMLPVFVDWLAKQDMGAPITVASPDVGGIKRVQVFREQLERRLGRAVELAFLEKRRVADEVSGTTLVGPVRGQHVVVLDDLCASGGTLVRAADAIAKAGAASVQVAVTHAAHEAGVKSLTAAASIARILITDSTAQPWHASLSSGHGKVQVLSVAPILGLTVRRVLAGESIAPLLQSWPPAASGS
jgi:ribose-phosphate pyrophosphokinase